MYEIEDKIANNKFVFVRAGCILGQHVEWRPALRCAEIDIRTSEIQGFDNGDARRATHDCMVEGRVAVRIEAVQNEGRLWGLDDRDALPSGDNGAAG